MKILLVEDEIHIAEPIKYLLKQNDYEVELAFDGKMAIDLILSKKYDAIILDIMIPKINGIEVLKKLRNDKIDVPVIILSARSQIDDKLLGFNVGADDYLTKPFHTEELLARINALIRRKDQNITELSYGNIKYNPYTSELISDSKSFELTQKEAQLMEMLLKNKKIIISKELIIEKIWEIDSDASYNHVEVYISFLRKKLNSLGSNVFIETKRGIGYKLVVRDKDV